MQMSGTESGIYIYLDESEVSTIRSRLGKLGRKAYVVISRAANRAAETARTEVKRNTAKHYITTQKTVEEGFSLKKASTVKPYATLSYNSPFKNLYEWHGGKVTVSPRYVHAGNALKPKFYKGRALRESALKPFNKVPGRKPFVQTMKNGYTALFQRKGKKRLPIEGIAGPAMSQGIKQPDVMNVVESKTMKVFTSRIEHEIDAILKGHTS